MKKLSFPLVLLLAASTIFTLYGNNYDNGTNNNPITPRTATTDPGVLVGEIDGKPIRWATRNVDMPGTFAERPESAGRLFQWGTFNGESRHFDPANHAVRDDRDVQVSFHDFGGNHFSAIVSRLVAWTPETTPCPPGWRVPTVDELQALRDVQSEWGELRGVEGRMFGTAPSRLFLPAAGVAEGSAFYWSNTPVTRSTDARRQINARSVNTWHLFLCPVNTNVGTFSRLNAFAIRCVAE